jgi:hypothetical protein
MEYPFRYRFASIHPSAWKGDPPKFVQPPFSEVPFPTNWAKWVQSSTSLCTGHEHFSIATGKVGHAA